MSCNRTTQRCDGTHRCCHEVLLEILDFTVSIFQKNDIPYWLTFGTLLGAVRSNKIIIWDEDIDIGIQLINSHTALKLAIEFQEAGHPWKVIVVPKGTACTITIYASLINSLHIDVSLYDTTCVNNITYAKSVLFPGSRTPLVNVQKGNLTTIDLEGKMYSCPKNPEELLKSFYGNDWQTPKIKNWIHKRLLQDKHPDSKVIDAIRHIGNYEWEPGRKVKE